MRSDLVYLLTSQQERVPAIHKRIEGATHTLLYSHGNGEDLGLMLDDIDELARHSGASVFAYEYVGYSLSHTEEGCEPSEDGCLRSADAAWLHLTMTAAVDPSKIIIVGRSIGSGPAVDLASRHSECAGVVLISPIASGAWAVLGEGAARALWALDLFRNYEKVGKLAMPVGIIHGLADEVVSVNNGYMLASLVPNPTKPLWIDGHGHNNLPSLLVYDFIKNFIEGLQFDRLVNFGHI